MPVRVTTTFKDVVGQPGLTGVAAKFADMLSEWGEVHIHLCNDSDEEFSVHLGDLGALDNDGITLFDNHGKWRYILASAIIEITVHPGGPCGK